MCSGWISSAREQISRIAADRVEEHEHEQHHPEQCRHELPGAANHVREHRVYFCVRSMSRNCQPAWNTGACGG